MNVEVQTNVEGIVCKLLIYAQLVNVDCYKCRFYAFSRLDYNCRLLM